MVKKKILFLILLTISLFLISGCIEKRECETSSDCTTRRCKTVQCIESKCSYNIIPNCCGNIKCEPNAGENKCTCADDCGKCEGRETFEDKATGGEKETEYLSYMCDEYDNCVLDSERKAEQFFKEKSLSYFDLGITSSFEQPFDVLRSSFRVKVELEDADEDLVFPINFTGIKVLDRQKRILGEKGVKKQLNKVGASFEEELGLLYGTDVLEEKKYVTIRINYEYSVLERIGRDEQGNPIYAPSSPERHSFDYNFVERLTFVNSRAK